MWTLLLLASCQAPAPPAAEASPSAWVYEPDTTAGAPDPAVVAAELQQLLDTMPTIHADAVVDAWLAARAYGDTMCPVEDVTESATDGRTVYFDGICLAQDDYWFKGPMTSSTFVDNTLADSALAGELVLLRKEPAVAWTGRAVRGQVDVYDRAGTMDFNCSCTAVAGTATTDDGVAHRFSFVDGPVHWTAPDAPQAWFDAGLQAQLHRYTQTTAQGTAMLAVEGTVTGATTVYGTIWVRLRLKVHRDGGGLGCSVDPFNAVLRDASGERVAIELSAEGDGCRFCGEVGGGEACVDVAGLVEAPW